MMTVPGIDLSLLLPLLLMPAEVDAKSGPMDKYTARVTS